MAPEFHVKPGSFQTGSSTKYGQWKPSYLN